MERHVELVFVAEILAYVFGPLVCFRQQHAVRVVRIQFPANALDDLMRLGQVLAIRAVPFHQVRNRVQTHSVHPEIEPEVHRLQHFFKNHRIIEIEIRLMRKKAVPVVSLGFRVPRPVGFFGIGKDDAGIPSYFLSVSLQT